MVGMGGRGLGGGCVVTSLIMEEGAGGEGG